MLQFTFTVYNIAHITQPPHQ